MKQIELGTLLIFRHRKIWCVLEIEPKSKFSLKNQIYIITISFEFTHFVWTCVIHRSYISIPGGVLSLANIKQKFTI